MTSSGLIDPRRRCSPSWLGAWRRSRSSSCSQSASRAGSRSWPDCPSCGSAGLPDASARELLASVIARSSGRARARPDTRRDARQSACAARAAARVLRGRTRRGLRAPGRRIAARPDRSELPPARASSCRPTTQRLLLVAAADPTGEPALLVRASAEHRRPDRRELSPAEADGLLELGPAGQRFAIRSCAPRSTARRRPTSGAPRIRRWRRPPIPSATPIAAPGIARTRSRSPTRTSPSSWSSPPRAPAREAGSRRPLRSSSDRRRSRPTRPAGPTARWKPPPASTWPAPPRKR